MLKIEHVTCNNIARLYKEFPYKPGGGAYPHRGFVCPVGILTIAYGGVKPDSEDYHPYVYCDTHLGRDITSGLMAGFDGWYRDRPLPMGESPQYRRACKVGAEIRKQLVESKLRCQRYS